jgi:hypothetical protein
MRNNYQESATPAESGARADWSKMPAFAAAPERAPESRPPGLRRAAVLKPGLY